MPAYGQGSGTDWDYSAEPFDYQHNPSWRIFRIMAEFVDGFNFITKFSKSVTFFGSARSGDQDDHYRSAQKLARMCAKAGFAVITGGGPGIMEAANKGALEGKGESVGLNIQLPFEQRVNSFVRKSIAFNYFFTRKVMLAFSASAFVFFPGGFGTLDEVFELLTLRQTHKINPRIPIILVGADFWGPLESWLKNNAAGMHGTIDSDELKLFRVVDSPEDAFEIIRKTKLR
ncbi:MAG: Rossman fold protein, TIGR00730 family [Candidatus Doudnabacteria bacterium RIFCSPHIGHO2_01_48_18]|nr:MAG: Rossman fold protein, TIGR00730 family [Candidatus Doudnabacteria bacterium RIFCSPHIGHO2_01_48_18]OGE79606.1 MAG: Rossman fold protein, TIGR00730 family [Candidatus Doudnabacteria bacterium RIFCSPHIGHO2_01_FULL_48_180]OGE91147.1 MAG: Rossman fold protein, TIGR00730 family [Candidatus Doudnabacteria bacterium RIFCSPHIGHO2_12_FULL_47_25]OGF00436.1 MAG: Rossman fold protein, TIGR00730 family [Candidatus Doudnabacteria bacterium RIFCSPLOWO2_12_FULL_47_12]